VQRGAARRSSVSLWTTVDHGQGYTAATSQETTFGSRAKASKLLRTGNWKLEGY